MSSENLAWAYTMKCGSAVDKLVLVVLADDAGDDAISRMPQDKLASRSECSTRTVQRALIRLEDRGFICRKRQINNAGLNAENSYRLLVKSVRHVKLSRRRSMAEHQPKETAPIRHLGVMSGFRYDNGVVSIRNLSTGAVVQKVDRSSGAQAVVNDASPTHPMDGQLRQDSKTDRGAMNTVCGEDTGDRAGAVRGGRA